MKRRDFLSSGTSVLATGALLSGADAATAATKPAMEWDPAHYSNYSDASRTAGDIRWVVLHTIEGSASAGISWFKNPDSDVSSHFVVDAGGAITKMVNVEDVAWTNGNGPYNDTAINIEMAGYAGETDFSEGLYQGVADLVAYLCDTYGVAVRHPTYDIAPCSAYDGDGGIIGHEQIPSPYDCSAVTGGKTDPGSTWNWDYLVQKVGGPTTAPTFSIGEDVVSTASVNVRSSAEVADNVKHTQPADELGTVASGYVTNDGFTWWWVEWANGVGGWSVEEYLGSAQGEESDAAFLIGEEVHPTTDLNVRTGASTSHDVVGVVSSTDAGFVKDGYVTADGYTWWEVDWQDGPRGWSAEAYLAADTGTGGSGREPSTDFTIETDLTQPVDVTGAEIDDAIAAERPDSPLVGLGDTFVAVQEEYSVNAVYQAAHAIHESAWGTSTIAQDKQNLFGWGAVDSDPYDGAKYFDTFADCVWYVMGEVADRYLEPGNWRYNGPHLEGMNVYYATDERWAEKIADHYRTLASTI
ncbi:N-acetylmuramoyl-L-alanine amidase [Haloarchaeobius amylolyticus]|uniref:N-acetylmuramoyl-L-alanine amidase n=1 Tax=Haloarchaeobius amylolyticus TaxID=1198296 RepID=UPI002270F22F|nr:N-acetylmuramoyl-L-alanine amidase [Haloarchaeobius amylolyticus]